MAVQVDSPGQLQDFLEILKKRKWQVLLPIAYTLTIGTAFAVLVPKKYECETQVELREVYFEGARNDKTKSISTIEAENARQQLLSLTRMRQVVEKLEWTDYLRLSRQQQNEFLIDMRKDLEVVVPRREGNVGSTFVSITYLDVNPQRAYQFLRELRTAWIQEVVERDREQIKFEFQNLQERQVEEERLFDKLQAELAQLKAANDLSPTQPGPGAQMSRSEDPHFTRLTENQKRLAELALEVSVAQAAQAKLEEELAGTEPKVPRTELVGGETYADKISQLKLEKLEIERELEEAGWRPPHSKYKEAQRKLEEIDRAIEDLQGETVASEERESWVPNPVHGTLDEQLIAARIETSKLEAEHEELRKAVQADAEQNRQRQEVYRKQSELDQRIEDSKARLSDLAIKQQAKRLQLDAVFGSQGNPFTVTQEPVPPTKPSEPNPILLIAFALVAGFAIGIGSAVLGEFSKSSFRTPADIGRVMVVPVLGVIGEIVTRAQIRRQRVRRMTVGISSAVILCSIAFVTWAWAASPNLLTPGMRNGIESFRDLLR